jgi:hypothetical protein
MFQMIDQLPNIYISIAGLYRPSYLLIKIIMMLST